MYIVYTTAASMFLRVSATLDESRLINVARGCSDANRRQGEDEKYGVYNLYINYL